MRVHSFGIAMLAFLMFLACSACKNKTKVEPPLETDPAKIILGKWEMIEIGNPGDMTIIENPIGYKEYLTDSVLKEYNYESGEVLYRIYWIDSLLNEKIAIPNGPTVTSKYLFNFTTRNTKMELEYYNIIAMNNNLVFKKIK